ncbi:hypothetical protein [Amycolatopsis sp. PS_44_ISF1]|uniref:hypothetical protein n=1 Tax=Amycolatopsis sp. PS_44_ISF1 TaxID=2974917 RepID=UPI0028DD80E9|nr:hypothetical protein [Amycolatopsis sp. PS_44_ISF1]MDT8915766.1 hypothetical protein [Amycolatopsis sp. PS_44_ISF1]MDT8916290.1 hypothetical protein [Amycolatopsis sp. PS_44_ISF1]MDT8916307.1 hypothetical protein [Amycolatopsis sp. PS_44_ISF1]
MSAWTFLAQRATTGEWLDWDVPITLSSLEWTLSGPGSLSGTVSPDVGGLRTDDGRLLLEEWGTLIYAESGGEIRWGGIVVSSSFEGEAWRIECAGFTTYPHAITYQGEYSKIGVDPADVVRELWRHVQSFPDSDLRVIVTGAASTSARLGTAAHDETATEPDGSKRTEHHDAEPYALLWWEHPNCGEELDNLAKQTPFDYIEKHYWSPDREAVVHEVELGYPRIGRRRDDLVFAEGENVTNVLSVESNGDEFANTILGLGAGEGRAMIRRETGLRDGRLRRISVYADKAVTDAARMDALIADELAYRKAALRITKLDVIDHPHAPIGSWQAGDDILVRAELPWLGEVEMWVRITAWSLTGDGSTASLDVTRSDHFRYGG